MFRIQKNYLLLAFLIFVVEVVIAVFVRDRWIRPFGGDFLVVILLYGLLKGFWDIPVWKAALWVLLFSYLIECLQYFQLVERLGLEHVTIARIVIGSTFEWLDLLAYTLGILLVLGLEKMSRSPWAFVHSDTR